MVQDVSSETSEALARSPIFSTLTPLELSFLSKRSYLTTYEEGESIFEQGGPALTLHIIASGMVKTLLRSAKGGEAVLAILVPGDFFGELSLLDGQPRSVSAVAVEPTETIALNRNDLLFFLKRHPDVAVLMLAALSSRLRLAHEFISDAIFLSTPARVAKKLLELANFRQRVDGSNQIVLPFTQHELAAMVGTSRESVNRALSFLEHIGAVKPERQKITILNLQRLKSAASQ